MIIAPGYTLRLSVKMLGKTPINGLEAEPAIDVRGVRVTLKQRDRFLVLSASEFPTEADAVAFLPRLKGGLWNLALEHNIAFIPFFERRDITRHNDPYEAARNLAKSFGRPLDDPIQPVHGLTEEQGYTVFPSNENIKFLRMGDASIDVSTAWANAAQTLAEGIEQVQVRASEENPNLATAIDLYLSSFYESSMRARFLTLMTALEVLAPVTEKHPVVVQHLSDLRSTVKMHCANEEDPEARDALEALLRDIDFRKETSIRRRIRHLVLTEAPMNESERNSLAKEAVKAYDLRGTVVHNGAIDPNDLANALETAVRTVKVLLRGRLGLTVDLVQ